MSKTTKSIGIKQYNQQSNKNRFEITVVRQKTLKQAETLDIFSPYETFGKYWFTLFSTNI